MTRWNKNDNIRNAGYWLSRKIELIELKHYNKENNITKDALRGGIFNVELGTGNIGGEKNKKRPCLVISRNNLNTGDNVVVIPLSTKYKSYVTNGVNYPQYKNHYLLKKSKYTFLRDTSCVKCEDIRNLDKIRLLDHLGNIDTKDLEEIKKRLLFALGY
ncbi:MAG: type II toxin-antitoxin system PemK/MazF family toxin [Sarcina sp.]